MTKGFLRGKKPREFPLLALAPQGAFAYSCAYSPGMGHWGASGVKRGGLVMSQNAHRSLFFVLLIGLVVYVTFGGGV